MNKIFYINLDSREDRKKLCEDQLNSLGWKYNRFSAINHSNGAAGCAMSHLKILEIARDNKLPYVIIFEDDFEITDKKLFLAQFKKILDNNIQFDVLKFGANAYPPYKYINDTHIGLNFSLAGHGYMVKKHYYPTLISNLKGSVSLLLKKGRGENSINCWDVRVNLLAKSDNWILLNPIYCKQRTDYSDIEEKEVNYNTCESLKIDKNIHFCDSFFIVWTEEEKEQLRKKYPNLTEYEYWSRKTKFWHLRLRRIEASSAKMGFSF